jgi:hypothetical protein
MDFYIVVRGHPRSPNQRNKEQPMNAVPVENSEQIEDDKNLAAVSEVEAGIRDFVRKDIAYLRRPVAPAGTDVPVDTLAEASVNSVSTLVQRVAGASVSEIETLIAELEGLRDLMHNEGQRIQRELAGYAQLGQTALKSTRMIADNLAQWKRTAPEPRQD